MSDYYPARAVVDLAALRHNVATLGAYAPDSHVLAVVKADAYGHGLIPSARAAVAAGASWLGTAQVSEALALRAAGITTPILAWLYDTRAPFAELLAADIDLSVGGLPALAAVVAAARVRGSAARVHVKVDTGLGRGGVSPIEFDNFLAALGSAVAEQAVIVVGVWSHLACADEPDNPFTTVQCDRLDAATARIEAAGIDVELRHIAATAATLTNPRTHLDLVRPGLGVYGMSPLPELGDAAHFGLRPVMTLDADLAVVKRVAAGQGVSYGLHYETKEPTVLAVVPLGYGDGIPRQASGMGGAVGGPVVIPVDGGSHDRQRGGRTRDGVRGRVCMDQFVIDLGNNATAHVGDRVVLFGDPAQAMPDVQEWAEAAQTINYEITTRLGARVPRVYIGENL